MDDADQKLVPQAGVNSDYGQLRRIQPIDGLDASAPDALSENSDEAKRKERMKQLAAIRAHPGLLNAFSIIGTVEGVLGGNLNAEDTLHTMLEIRPDLSQAALDRAKVATRSGDAATRSNAQSALMMIAASGSREVVPEIIELAKTGAKDKEAWVRWAAITALSTSGDVRPDLTETVLPSIELAARDPDANVRAEVQNGLGSLLRRGNHDFAERVFSTVKIGLDDADDGVRGAAQLALATVVKARPELAGAAFDLAKKGANDVGTATRTGAMNALGEIALARPELGEQVLALVEKGGSDPNRDVRYLAMDALGSIVSARPDLGEKVLDLLKKGVEDADSGVREVTQNKLRNVMWARHDLAESVVPVAAKAAESDPDESVRSSARGTILEVPRQNRPDVLSKIAESRQAVSAKQESRPLQRAAMAP